jgi:hypothetical protein
MCLSVCVCEFGEREIEMIERVKEEREKMCVFTCVCV